jgi:hypothetical protein
MQIVLWLLEVIPLAITDDQMSIIQRAASPLHPHDRGPFLERVAELLRGHELGDGIVSRAAREAQARFWRPPELAHAAGPTSKYR